MNGPISSTGGSSGSKAAQTLRQFLAGELHQNSVLCRGEPLARPREMEIMAAANGWDATSKTLAVEAYGNIRAGRCSSCDQRTKEALARIAARPLTCPHCRKAIA